MLPGRHPKPGSRHSRAQNMAMPEPADDKDIARVRARLGRAEAVWWFDLVEEEARASGILTLLDLGVFAEWAEYRASWEIHNASCIEWEKSLCAATAETAETASVYPRCYALRKFYASKLRETEAKLGFSASDRTRISVASKQGDMFESLATTVQYTAHIPERRSA